MLGSMVAWPLPPSGSCLLIHSVVDFFSFSGMVVYDMRGVFVSFSPICYLGAFLNTMIVFFLCLLACFIIFSLWCLKCDFVCCVSDIEEKG